MTPVEFQRVAVAFQHVRELPLGVREAWLATRLGSRPDLLGHVQKMLVADQRDPFRRSPLYDHLATVDLAASTDPGRRTNPENEPSSDKLPPSLPGYQLLRELGRGGMGVVFKARQHAPQRIVAVKMILAGEFASAQEVERFRAEAQAAANLSHSGIVPIYEVGHHQGRHFFSMGYIEGESLAAVIGRQVWSPEKIAQLVLKIAEAMAHAHAAGIVHRDLKPSNILLDPQGEPRVTDFGLAKRLGEDSEMTYSGQILGSPGYMAPEQAAGRRHEISAATDIYGLGAILYALITGRPPFETKNLLEAIDQICTSSVTPPRKLVRTCPKPLETICMKCLHKSPGARYRSMQAVAADLQAFLNHEPIQARPLSVGERIVFWARRKPGLASTWGAVALFFLYHLVSSYVIQDERSAQGFFRVASVGFALAFAGGGWFFQRLYEKPSRRKVAIYGWMTWNLTLLTGLLFLTIGAASPLSLIYLLLVAVSATLYEKGLVGYTMTVAAAGYLLHVVMGLTIRPGTAVDFHQSVCMLLSIVVLGMIQYFVVRRIRRTMDACD